MMDGVSPKTCCAIKKHWNNKFYYTTASCWFFRSDLYYDARIPWVLVLDALGSMEHALGTTDLRESFLNSDLIIFQLLL